MVELQMYTTMSILMLKGIISCLCQRSTTFENILGMEGKGQLKISENIKISLPKLKLSHQNLKDLLLNALKN